MTYWLYENWLADDKDVFWFLVVLLLCDEEDRDETLEVVLVLLMLLVVLLEVVVLHGMVMLSVGTRAFVGLVGASEGLWQEVLVLLGNHESFPPSPPFPSGTTSCDSWESNGCGLKKLLVLPSVFVSDDSGGGIVAVLLLGMVGSSRAGFAGKEQDARRPATESFLRHDTGLPRPRTRLGSRGEGGKGCNNKGEDNKELVVLEEDTVVEV